MARRSKRLMEVSLFPFLSVLVSVIGALALIIIGTTLGSTASRMETFPDIDPRKVQSAKLAAQRDLLATGVEAQSKRLKSLQAKLAEIAELRPAVARMADSVKANEKAGADEEAHVARLTQQIEEEIRRREDLQARHNAGQAAKIRVPDAARGKAPFRPVFIECRREGIAILQSGQQIPTDQISTSAALGRVLANLRTARESWCAFLLIRPEGMDAFQRAFDLIGKAGVRYGMHPVLTKSAFDVKDWQRPDWLK